MEPYVIKLDELGMNDVEIVGGKNASLGEMISNLSNLGVSVPGGFATTSAAYRAFLSADALDERIATLLKDLDVDDIGRSTEFYDAMAQKPLGRSRHHVLLLHENDVAALYIGDLVTALRERGFRIISPSEAFTDPIAEAEPDTLFLGQGRIAALAHEEGWAVRDLVSPTEDEDYLRRRFQEEVVALPAP